MMSQLDDEVEPGRTLPAGIGRRTLLRGALGLAGLAAGATALGGCGGSAAGASEPVKLWHLFTGADGSKISTMLADVQREHPGLDVEATCLSWGSPYYTKLAMASAGRRPPDAAVLHVSRLAGYAPGGLLTPWDEQELSRRGIGQDTTVSALWDRCRYDGRLYSLPLDTHPFIAFYDLDVVEKAGVAGPDGYPVIESTDQLLEVGTKLAEATGRNGIAYGYVQDSAQPWRFFWGLFGQTGGHYDFTPGKKATWDEDAAIKVITFVTSMLDDKVCPRGLDGGGAVSSFTGGGAGMFLGGEWELAGLGAVKHLGGSPMPTMFGTPASYADSHSFVLPAREGRSQEHVERTYDLVTGLVKDALVWARAGHIPAYLPVTRTADYQHLQPQSHYAPAAEHVFLDPPVWFSGAGSDFQNQMSSRLQQAFLRRMSPADAQRSMLDSITSFLALPNPA